MTLGLWDKRGRAWLGDPTGPALFEDTPAPSGEIVPARTMAGVARTLWAIRLGWKAKRIEVRVFTDDRRTLRLKDSWQPSMTGLEAVQIAEGDRPFRRPRNVHVARDESGDWTVQDG